MQSTKRIALGLSLAFAVAASAAAQTQTVVIPDSPPGGDTVIIVPAPQSVPDPAAVARCQMVAAPNYWDCVNSYHGGG